MRGWLEGVGRGGALMGGLAPCAAAAGRHVGGKPRQRRPLRVAGVRRTPCPRSLRPPATSPRCSTHLEIQLRGCHDAADGAHQGRRAGPHPKRPSPKQLLSAPGRAAARMAPPLARRRRAAAGRRPRRRLAASSRQLDAPVQALRATQVLGALRVRQQRCQGEGRAAAGGAPSPTHTRASVCSRRGRSTHTRCPGAWGAMRGHSTQSTACPPAHPPTRHPPVRLTDPPTHPPTWRWYS